MQRDKLKRLAHALEQAVVGLAIVALGFRALVYPGMARPPGAAYGPGDVTDFVLALVLFALSCACAGCAVALSAGASDEERALSYRPALVGMTTFVAYHFIHQNLPGA